MSSIWQGEKIRLRAVKLSDLENYFMKDGNTDTKSQRAGDRVVFPYGEELLTERVLRLSKANPYEDEFFMIIEDAEGIPVGNINSHSCNRLNGTFEYGLGIKRPFRGRGYATEAIKLLLNFYFMELGYHKAEARVYDFNHESIKLHEKFGYELEGRLRSHHYTMGTYYDELCFGMTRSEFEEKHLQE